MPSTIVVTRYCLNFYLPRLQSIAACRFSSLNTSRGCSVTRLVTGAIFAGNSCCKPAPNCLVNINDNIIFWYHLRRVGAIIIMRFRFGCISRVHWLAEKAASTQAWLPNVALDIQHRANFIRSSTQSRSSADTYVGWRVAARPNPSSARRLNVVRRASLQSDSMHSHQLHPVKIKDLPSSNFGTYTLKSEPIVIDEPIDQITAGWSATVHRSCVCQQHHVLPVGTLHTFRHRPLLIIAWLDIPKGSLPTAQKEIWSNQQWEQRFTKIPSLRHISASLHHHFAYRLDYDLNH